MKAGIGPRSATNGRPSCVLKDRLGLVVQSNKHGILAWPLVEKVMQGVRVAVVDLSPSADMLFWRVTTFDESHWTACPHIIWSPVETSVRGVGDQLCGIHFKLHAAQSVYWKRRPGEVSQGSKAHT